MYKLNGIEVEYNIFDTNLFKKFELGVTHVKREFEELKDKDLMQYEKAEICCRLVVDLITDLFGKEMCEQIIPNQNDMMVCTLVFAELMEISNESVATNNKRLEKYTLNRLNGKHSSR